MPTSSSCCSALWVCVLTSSSLCRSLAISPRMRSRSGLLCAVVRPNSNSERRRRTLTRRIVAQGLFRRLLLRLLLRRSLAARHETANLHLDDEALLVIRADLLHDAVLRQLKSLPLRQLLQRRLVVLEQQIFGVDRFDVLRERALDQRARRFDAAVEVNRGDHRFEKIRQQRLFLAAAGLLLAHTEIDHFTHSIASRLLGEACGTDEICLHFRQRAFVECRELLEQDVADDEAEDGVTEKLERLVVECFLVPRLMRIRFVA